MNLLKVPTFFAFLISLTSCAISKYSAPPFTDLDKILELKPDQTLKEVNDVLKIKPYDVVYSHDKGKMILIYNYRVKDRRMGLPTKTATQVMHSENAQRQGDVWYNINYRELFVLFQNGKIKSIYGEEALSGAGQIEMLEAYLNGNQNPNGTPPREAYRNEDLLFARNVYQERNNRKNTELSEDKAAKKRRNLLLGGTAVLIVGIMQIFK